MSAPAIEVAGLVKHFGAVRALDGVDLECPEGEVVGLLGPNGAGKTTLVRALSTLLAPDAGQAAVLGVDVMAEPVAVRRMIGLAGQFAAVDEMLTGRENLVLVGRLYHLGRGEAHRRAAEVLERFGLTEAADRRCGTYSGGMRRRLDLAATLVGRPRVIFLDEPTAGLDPRSRSVLWTMVRELRAQGTTVLLTTQYLEEADQLAQAIAVIDRGQIVARGTAAQLKERVGAERLVVRIAEPERTEEARALLLGDTAGDGPEVLAPGEISLPMKSPESPAAAVRSLDQIRLGVVGLEVRSPTLDDVFLTLTGRTAPSEEKAG
jgi:ABC-2 type transport system ATP-binding protein